MKAIQHERSEVYRVVQRGKLFYVQYNDGSKADKEQDSWYDIGKAHDTERAAISAMYVQLPLVKS